MKIKYTEEQKQEAVRMLEELGPAKTKQILGIPTTTVYRWKTKLNPLCPSEADDECFESADLFPETESPEEAVAAQADNDNNDTPSEKDAEDGGSVVLADGDSLILGGILMKLHFLSRENEALREENDGLRKSMVALLQGKKHE